MQIFGLQSKAPRVGLPVQGTFGALLVPSSGPSLLLLGFGCRSKELLVRFCGETLAQACRCLGWAAGFSGSLLHLYPRAHEQEHRCMQKNTIAFRTKSNTTLFILILCVFIGPPPIGPHIFLSDLQGKIRGPIAGGPIFWTILFISIL